MVVIFTHIPKTAGNTFASILYKQYDYETEIIDTYGKDSLPENINYDNIKCVVGHHQFGLHTHIPRPSQYITVLRDPVDRVISDYYFDLKFHGKKIEDWPIQPFIKHFSNRQTRWIAGNDQEDLALAKANLNDHFIFAGLTEWFDESLFIMKQKLGWQDISYKKYNVNEKRSKVDQVSDDVLDEIKKHNQLDIQLHAYVKNKLQMELNNLDGDAQKELRQYKNRLCRGAVSDYANPQDYIK